MMATDLKKKDWIEQTTVCLHQNLKPGYFDDRRLGETTLSALALNMHCEDYESKTYKPLAENPRCYTSHRNFINTFTN